MWYYVMFLNIFLSILVDKCLFDVILVMWFSMWLLIVMFLFQKKIAGELAEWEGRWG